MNIYRIRFLITLGVFFGATSCLDYHPPKKEAPMVKSWKTEQVEKKEAAKLPEARDVIVKWWLIFDDEELNRLQEEALAQNPNLMLAEARLKEAQAFFTIENSNRFPDLTLTGIADRRHLSKNGATAVPSLQSTNPNATAAPSPPFNNAPIARGIAPSMPIAAPLPLLTPAAPPPGAPPPARAPSSPKLPKVPTVPKPRRNVSFFQVAPQLSYEVDFWGRYSKAAASAKAEVKGAEEAVRTAYLMLTTQIAQVYYQIQALDAQIRVEKKTIFSYQHQVEITDAKFKAGISPALDFLQADVELTSLQAQYEETKKNRAIAENLLATLLGTPASLFTLPEQNFDPKFPYIPTGLPSEILKQRPDIREAEDNVESARLTVGVAKTAFFPSITLNGVAGYQSNKVSSLFKWKNHILSGTASLLQPIFDGGFNIGQLRLAKAQYEETVAMFLNTVITAYQEVEDSLSTYEISKKQNVFRTAEYKSAAKLLNLTNLQYQNGIIDYLNVIFAERTALTAELDSISTTNNRIFALINLIKSLGGTWES